MVLFAVQMFHFHRITENKAGGVERCYKSSFPFPGRIC